MHVSSGVRLTDGLGGLGGTESAGLNRVGGQDSSGRGAGVKVGQNTKYGYWSN